MPKPRKPCLRKNKIYKRKAYRITAAKKKNPPRLDKFGGWQSKRIGLVNFFQCPTCGQYSEVLHNRNDLAECHKCKTYSPANKFKIASLKRPIVVCKACSEEVSLTPINLWEHSYICPSCKNNVAIKFKGEILRPQTVLDLDWNNDLKRRGLKISSGLSLATCESSKDSLVLGMMQSVAQSEDSSFRSFSRVEQKAALVFDTKRKRYCGYVIWTEGQHAIIRQLFVTKDVREKGYGTNILRFWAEKFADRLNAHFGVETPNGVSQKILLKLGYAKSEEGYLKGIKCFFTQ